MNFNESNNPTVLEHAILELYYAKFIEQGFPSPKHFAVSGRKNTGSGRYTYLSHSNETDLPDGRLDLGTYGQINMDNVRSGASFALYVKGHKIIQMEIAVNGTESWDGIEGDWKICDPDTGES